MIPNAYNPHGLETRTVTFHVLKNNEEVFTFSSQDRLYRYVTFPNEVIEVGGEYWTTQCELTPDSYSELQKYVSRDSLTGQKYMLYSNVDLYKCIFEYTVHWNTMGGDSIPDSKSIDGSIVSLPPTPSMPNANFIGWYTQPSGGQRIDSDFVPSQDITCYARWNLSSNSMIFYTNGGRWSNEIPIQYELNGGTFQNKWGQNV